MELEGNENFATEQYLEDWVIEKCDDGVTTLRLTTQRSLMNTTACGVVSGLHKTVHAIQSVLRLSLLHYSRLLSHL